MGVRVYTAVFGGYDTLAPARTPSLCFMDGKMAPVPGWEYRTMYAGEDPKWANRRCKILAHLHVDAEYSIYHDGNVEMLVDPDRAVGRWLENHDIAVFAHPDRTCVYQEGAECIRIGKAPADRVDPHLARYRQAGYPENNGLAACWVVIRRHTKAIERLNDRWWAEYEAGAKRDQLSFDYACWKEGIEYAIIPGNLFEGTSEAFRRTPHEKTPTMLSVDWKTAYGQVLLENERQFLKDAAEQIQCKFGLSAVIVNVGVFRCASMYCLRAGAPDARLIGVDIKKCDVPIDPGLEAEFIVADSAKCHSQVEPPVHLLFIDGDHHHRAVEADLEGWTPKIPVGGIAVMHDYAPQPKHLASLPELEGVRRATNEWFAAERWERLEAPDSLAAFERLE